MEKTRVSIFRKKHMEDSTDYSERKKNALDRQDFDIMVAPWNVGLDGWVCYVYVPKNKESFFRESFSFVHIIGSQYKEFGRFIALCSVKELLQELSAVLGDLDVELGMNSP